MTSASSEPVVGLALPVAGAADLEDAAGDETLICAVGDAVETVALSALRSTATPRIEGEDHGHVLGLADCDLPLPPIVVHRPTMQVIDGVHRLRAAQLKGDTTIGARFFDGSPADAFVLAVRLNSGHGLPLSRAARSAAARRIMISHPHWSDRRIAAAVGLSAKTVGGVRRSTWEVPQLNTRLGRDGRTRPLDATDGRRRAAAVVTATPTASLRAIARAAGVSVATARDVRERLRLGRGPLPGDHGPDGVVPPPQPCRPAAPLAEPRPAAPVRPNRDAEPAILVLRRDPSLRFTEVGRLFLRLLGAHPMGPEVWDRFVEGIPAHCADSVSQLARRNAEDWLYFADAIDEARRTGAGGDGDGDGPGRS
ncbi:hypothetical protein POF50_033870 [Streptomyces sp. SL13]|uniref:ParB-like N-terminal domain-containing protein n=1 Tax=Streptantibioticus silvisoli TaxID=2705255 RepID=A0AA90K213_9ACTN|nr:hypothetical protein [Streptantibioticus silvisoli]MDI5966353.1 hypothetical protein [Streptantibioticus silvisoli]MDI5974276.1 hypothetical protein [Streptantibioticus silvisoli]